MIDRLSVFLHENGVPIFELKGYLTKKTIMSFIINIDRKRPFIIQMAGIEGIDKFSVRLLKDLAKICSFEIWDLNPSLRGFLKGINVSMLP